MTDRLALRPVGPGDAALLFEWANDPTTRSIGFHPEPIEWPTHVAWLDGRLASPNARQLLGSIDDRPIGLVRFDRAPDGVAEVGISVAREARGRGLGRALLEAGIAAVEADREYDVRDILARVRVDNAVSLAMFQGAGFVERERATCNGWPCVVLARATGAGRLSEDPRKDR